MLQNLAAHIRKYIPLLPQEEALLLQHISLREVKKKELLLKAGKRHPENYFVIDGCLRLYSVDEDGRERIVQFAIENWWMADFMNQGQKNHTPFYIDAVENSTLAVMNNTDWGLLTDQVPQLEKYFRIIFQRAYSASLWRINHIYCHSGAERYYRFVALYPWFVQRIPQYMLASYLGLTPEFISMIRAKKK